MERRRWNPWATLRSSPWIVLQYADIDGADAEVETTPEGGYLVTIDHALDRRERRCALAHELCHIERDLIWPPGTAGQIIMRGELWVDRMVADRLVPSDELLEFVQRFVGTNEMVLARDVADEFDVTIDVADRALCHLEERVRGAA